MASWTELGYESRTASFELFETKRWRNSISRAYYAVFARAAGDLAAGGVTMANDREGPSHAKLPGLLLNNLKSLPLTARRELYGLVSKLYFMRLQADYMPSVDLGDGDARNSKALMLRAFKLLEGR